MEMRSRAVKLVVRGKVQQVGYRAAIYGAIIDQLDSIVGYIQNLANGDVEICISGDPLEIKKAMDIAYLGSKKSQVEGIEVIEINPSEVSSENFIILS